MRFLTVAVVAGAAILVLVFALSSLRTGEAPETLAVHPSPQPQGGEVEDRLRQLQADYRKRRPGKRQASRRREPGRMNPVPRGRELPGRAGDAPELPAAEPEDVAEKANGEDEELQKPEEMEELRSTLLTHPDPDERIGAVLMLTGTDSPEALDLLVEAGDDPDPEVRVAIVEALGDYSDQLNPDVMVPFLNDPDPDVRFEALGVIGDLEDPAAMVLVRGALKDPDEDVRTLAEGILGLSDHVEENPGAGYDY